ncbi:GNAT family N-acetyltransferase [Lentzea sp. NBRC 105346]|uniref:GNAT family N-acetyltransferase n=1 Tax=Lentzea sp. NBRC 105346 TaxID=3032205 RepID=UPI0025541738|nr:GNAT family N-acetyltransferase [Lentzea sp. NBRC 105346]
MYDIRFAEPGDLSAALALLVRLQADTAHHIGYLGETVEALSEELAEFEPDWSSCSVVATDESGRLAGFLSVEIDSKLRRAWLHGPFVDVPLNHPAGSRIWDQTADALFVKAREILDDITDHELYGHTNHRRLAAFAQRHGFTAGKASSIYLLDNGALRTLLLRDANYSATHEMRVLPTDPAVHEAVAVLHERCFPHSYMSGRQLVDGTKNRTVVVAMDGQRVLGYAGGKAQPEEYYVDFVAVEPDARGQGIGAQLVTELLWKLACDQGARPQAAASILAGNESSRRMFGRLGFRLHLELVAYRHAS